jgi:hypothetical protein
VVASIDMIGSYTSASFSSLTAAEGDDMPTFLRSSLMIAKSTHSGPTGTSNQGAGNASNALPYGGAHHRHAQGGFDEFSVAAKLEHGLRCCR